MCSEYALSAEGLTKCYRIFAQPHHRLLQSLWRGRRRYYREFWALKDVDLQVRRGQTVGVIGRNGSGKSTLLRIIAGTLTASSGALKVNGRVSALLELGSGFDPEFTGRENVFMNGAILGIEQREMQARFKRIVDFSGISDYIDQPVKTYSSGMFSRLGFSVAVHADPDILIIDEALSVGDEAFQRKCFARIKEIKERGATILFVSHSGGAVVELCDEAILLDDGEVLYQGTPKKVLSAYQKLIYSEGEQGRELRQLLLDGRTDAFLEAASNGSRSLLEDAEASPDFDRNLIPQSTVLLESSWAEIQDPHMETLDGERVNVLVHGAEYVYCYHVRCLKAMRQVVCAMLIKTVSGVIIGGGNSEPPNRSLLEVAAGESLSARFTFRCMLNPGSYFLNAGVWGNGGDGYGCMARILDAAIFRVKPVADLCANGWVDFDLRSQVQRYSSTLAASQ